MDLTLEVTVPIFSLTMAMMKRIVLFLAVNILVMITINFVLHLLGANRYLTAYGLDYQSLAIFCLAWGTGGAFISLMLSKVMAKWMMGVQIIDPQTRDADLQQLVQTVHALARSAGLPKMPEVGIFDSPVMNAFATGPSRSNSLVAVSTGLLRGMKPKEVEGVLGHEIAHVANGDMVTMTLVQGIVNAFAMFLARILAFALTSAGRNDDRGENRGGGFMQFMLVQVFEIVFMILGTIVVAAFSRWREFRADAGGARLAGRDAMIAALERLRAYQQREEQAFGGEMEPAPAFRAMMIKSRAGGILALFSTHPPLEQRIARLETATNL